MHRLYLLGLSLMLALPLAAAPFTADLSGEWRVSLQEPAAAATWSPIRLPGTLTDAGLGEPMRMKPELTLTNLAHLQAKFGHIGPAWYRREVDIPPEWANRRIVLELERVLWESQVWVDGRHAGRADSLVAPHVHDLSALLPPGRHELLVRIDNREIHPGLSLPEKKYPVPADRYLAHAYTNHTQTIWNGMLGALRLRAEESAEIARLAIFPRRGPAPALRIEGRLSASPEGEAGAPFRFVLRDARGDLLADRVETLGAAGSPAFSFDWALPEEIDVRPWNEFSPALYQIEARPVAQPAPIEPQPFVTRFGFRELKADDGELRLDGRRIFLRGTLECAVFPLTGYPPTDKSSWRRIFERAREWGLNHLRFHSWCPPAAAFDAADELGMYLQIELPHWSLEVGRDPSTWAFLQEEAQRILSTYGNHPSFMFLSLGNELQGDMPALDTLVRQLRRQDDRRLYTATTFTFQKGHGRAPGPDDQFFITQYTADGWVRGQGVFNDVPPAFDVDYHAAAKGIRTPLVSHEIGQFAVFPDLGEIDRYTGNLVPTNLVAIRDDLARKSLLELAPRFLEASGKFAGLLYKEEIERALRTREFDGFQLLGLQDFPGQGTALVGLLNAFWDSKGVMRAETFREFCGPLTPLARFPKAVYERAETFRAGIEIANFERDLKGVSPRWTIRRDNGSVVASGECAPVSPPAGAVTPAGGIEFPIPEAGGAERWELEVSLDGHPAKNRWNVWVYPVAGHEEAGDVRVVSSLDEALRALEAGESVLFNPPAERIRGVPGRFVPVFWSPVHFPDQPGTMGILCDPAHPALREFPTAAHSDWQWWDLALRSRGVAISAMPVGPIVRVIDNFNRNQALACVFEAKVGRGRLLFSSIDLTGDLARRPAARQLRTSLLRYMRGESFQPDGQLSPDALRSLIAPATGTSDQ